jgi:DNA repair protein RadD
MLALRPYQREALDALYAYWQGGGGNGLLVLPTGAGKSLVIATLARELLEGFPGIRIGIVTHVKELIAQNAQELIRAWPGAPVGIYSAGLGRRDVHSRILFMGIQSVHRKVDHLGDIDVLIVDEAHLIPRSSDTMYGRFLGDLRARVPDMRIVGLTATPYRLDSGRLDRGREALFDDVVYEVNVRDLIEAGYLSRLISKATLQEISTSGVGVRGGEFIPGQLQAAARRPSVVVNAVREIIQLGADRRGWLAFCTGVEHATDVRDCMREQGITCEMVTGDTDAAERDSIIARYKRREIRCLTSIAVLTTGFNAPHVDLIAMLRPTLSTGLYIQMVGRGFRLADGKDDCLVLDFAGNVRRHGPVDAVTVKREPGGGREQDEMKVKPESVLGRACPTCKTISHISRPACETCGYEWPRLDKPKHQATAEVAPILTTEAPADRWLEVRDVAYERHEKAGAPPSLRVEYLSGPRVYREWVCLEHSGFAREKAGMVWRRLGGLLPIPQSVDEALERLEELATVTGIRVKEQGKYPEVIARRIETAPRQEAAE